MDDEKWIEIKGRKTNKPKATQIDLTASINLVTPNKYIILSTYIKNTPIPPTLSPPDNKTLAAKRHTTKRPTQKHVRHTLRLLAQQESAFLEQSTTRAENETTEMAKNDKTNKQRVSINKSHQLPHHQLEWQQKAKNTSHQITCSPYCAFKLAKLSVTQTKTVRFATTRTVCVFQNKEVAALITYDSGADGHYLSKRHCKIAGLPILCQSHKCVGVANSGTSMARHVSRLPFRQLSDRAASADTFNDFPSSLMSVGKTSDDGTISIFTKDGVTVHKEQDVLITYKGKPILIGIHDSKGRYCIPLMQQRGHWQPRRPSKKARQTLRQANSVYDLPSIEHAIKWMYAVCGYPVKTTWIKAVKQAIL